MLQLDEMLFAQTQSLQGCFPALLQLRRDQPVVGVAGGVATLGERRLVTCLLKIEFADAVSLCLGLHELALDVSADIMEHVDPIFFGDPKTAAMKVLGLV